ncbi:23052_t:CDS:2, partial [Racocetra persica]
ETDKSHAKSVNLKTQEQQKARIFKAQPLPSDSPDPLPPARTIPTTKSKPFKLETDARGEKYQQQLHQELTKMKRRDKENHIFHAKPAPKFPTTQVKKPSKPPTVPVSFVFQTDTRMKERKAYDQQRKLRDQMENILREKKRDVRHM